MPSRKRRVVWLVDAMRPGAPLGLMFNVDRRAKTFEALPARAETYNRAQHPVDAAKLMFDGTTLEGELGIAIKPDGYVPADKKPVDGVIKLKASLDGKDKSGTYSAVFGVQQQREGQVSVRPGTESQLRELLAPILSYRTPWRVWLVTGPRVTRNADGKMAAMTPGSNPPRPQGYDAKTAHLSELPAGNWTSRDCDDSLWARYADDLYEFIGGYGVAGSGDPALLCLRTRFGVSDPAKATDVKVTVEYLGGAVIYVNGAEVGRSHVPEGTLEPHVPAADYPIEAYTVDDGGTPLPVVGLGAKPEPKWLPRYQARVRRMTVPVPSKLLVKGSNVLAVELRRAAGCGPMQGYGWSHLAIRGVSVTSASGAGLIPFDEACKGTRVWSAQELEQVAARPVPRSRIAGGWARGVGSVRGMPIVGVSAGSPFDPLQPVRILVPRNGVGRGQAVLADPDGLHGVIASVRDLVGPNKAVLPARAVRVYFASQGPDIHWCDNLLDKPEDGATTLPVWLNVQAPKDQPSGWYVSTLSLEANGKKFDVPVQVFVTGYAVPDARDLRSLIGVMHSPEATATTYGVAPWSDEHFKVIAKSLEMAGQLGNDIMYVPVLVGQHMGHKSGLIRWIKTEKGLQPDFTLFEKYLDLYARYCAPPKAMSLYVWSAESAKEVAIGYEGNQQMTAARNPKASAQVTQWDPQTGATANVVVPTFLDEGAEAFWKPMLDGVHAIVKKRGWPERVIMLGLGSDTRPSQKTGELLRQWAPYARWDIYSHFSGDPGCTIFYKGSHKEDLKAGRLIAIGDLEVGMKEYPWGDDALWLQNLEFLDLPLQRGCFYDQSPPMSFRTWPLHSGRLARVGLEFWPGVSQYRAPIWGCFPLYVAGHGADGPVPT
ncbi:MAG: glycoside hydrolase domain-containing protein, partial [Thermoguttaceae bacterium]